MFAIESVRSRSLRFGCVLGCAACLALFALPAPAAKGLAGPEPRRARADSNGLFQEEIQQAVSKLRWRGERLPDDTIYAIALTGISWELAWGKEHLFSLAWGDIRKVAPQTKRSSRNQNALIEEIGRAYSGRDYRRAVDLATANFSPDEIGCLPTLKNAVGFSLLEMGQPERAFPILSAPFDPQRSQTDVSDLNIRFREGAFEAAQRARLPKEATAFALSLLLEPGNSRQIHQNALRYLERSGVDIEKVMLGIMQAPDRLRGLPNYTYAAADLLILRTSPRLLPLFRHLAESDDVYLRGRALIGLSILAHQTHPLGPAGWESRLISHPLREYGLSSGERRIIDEEIREGARSDKYRLRAASAVALGILGGEDVVPLLQKLAHDRAYVLSPQEKGNRSRRIFFPVRAAAAAALIRYGVRVETGEGEFSGRDLDRARQGGQDVSNDRSNLRREIYSQIIVSPVDAYLMLPSDTARR